MINYSTKFDTKANNMAFFLSEKMVFKNNSSFSDPCSKTMTNAYVITWQNHEARPTFAWLVSSQNYIWSHSINLLHGWLDLSHRKITVDDLLSV